MNNNNNRKKEHLSPMGRHWYPLKSDKKVNEEKTEYAKHLASKYRGVVA